MRAGIAPVTRRIDQRSHLGDASASCLHVGRRLQPIAMPDDQYDRNTTPFKNAELIVPKARPARRRAAVYDDLHQTAALSGFAMLRNANRGC